MATSGWETIESAVVQSLSAIMLDGSALLATVKGRTSRDRKALLAEIGRERLPAAYVVMTGREAGDKSSRRPGSPTVSVLLATRSLRQEDDARTGAADVTGIFSISEAVVAALGDLVIDEDRLLWLIDERPVSATEGTVVWEQRYEPRRRAGLSQPLFRNPALVGSDSEVEVELGELRCASSSFSFPGIEGVFIRQMGARERPIFWRGQLRAADDDALNAIERGIEDELRLGLADSMWDPWGRTHHFCTLKAFRRKGPRRRDELSGEALQDFELEFTQLAQ